MFPLTIHPYFIAPSLLSIRLFFLLFSVRQSFFSDFLSFHLHPFFYLFIPPSLFILSSFVLKYTPLSFLFILYLFLCIDQSFNPSAPLIIYPYSHHIHPSSLLTLLSSVYIPLNLPTLLSSISYPLFLFRFQGSREVV